MKLTLDLIFLGAQLLYAIGFILMMRWGGRLLQGQQTLMKAGSEGVERAIENWREAQRQVLLAYETLDKVQTKLMEKISN